MRKVRTHKFNGVKYHVDVDDAYNGWCDSPKKPLKYEYPAVRLPDGLPFGNTAEAKEGLVTLLHECLHASNYNTHEDTVDRVSIDIGNLLWRLGYRRQKK